MTARRPSYSHFPTVLAAAALAVCQAGCLRSYVDPEFDADRVGFNQLRRSSHPSTVRLVVDFRGLGQHMEGVSQDQYVKLARTINDSGVFVVKTKGEEDPGSPTLHFVIDDTGDTGIGPIITGLTFFIVGCTVEDDYECRAWMEESGTIEASKTYKSKVVSSIGLLVATPDGWRQTPTASAADDVLQQFVLRFLLENQGGAGTSAYRYCN